jgi:hypothetical protein
MHIKKVKSYYEIREFHNITYTLYKNEKTWIPHIKQEIENIFNPSRNSFHNHGEIERFILQNNNNTVGRIAVFINEKSKNKSNQSTGGIGFFECENNQKYANKLFNHAIEWLKKRDIEAMDGPINFGEKDKYWGLMVEGFDKHTVYGQNHHLDYYKDLFENFGFKGYYNQHVYCKDLYVPYPDKFYERAERIKSRENITFRHMVGNDYKKYAQYFITVYNVAWGSHHNFKPMKLEQAEKIFTKMKMVIDKELIWFAFYKEAPIAFFLGIPDPNQYLKYINGNLNWFGKLKVLFSKLFIRPNVVSAMVFGVIPKFQKLGIESALADHTSNIMKQNGYRYVVQTWIGDFNPKMIKVCESFFQSDVYQKLTTYRYLFNRKSPFEKHPIIK